MNLTKTPLRMSVSRLFVQPVFGEPPLELALKLQSGIIQQKRPLLADFHDYSQKYGAL
jgi:hypothetical protein